MPDISIIIINWRSADLLEHCLRSIYETGEGVSFEIIVLDNGSFDGSAEMVSRQFVGVHYIQGKRNVGFAQANNLAYSFCRGHYILFLNPDTELQKGALKELADCLDRHPKAGIAGPRLLNSDRTLQKSCIQSYPTVLNQVFDAEPLRRLFPTSPLWGTRALYESDGAPAKIEAVSGACLLARRQAFEDARQFTTAYFMYCEDLDLCYKVHRAGWDLLHIESAVVVHHGGQSSNRESQNNFAVVMTRESLYKFMRLRRSKGYAVGYRFATILTATLRLSLLATFYLLTLGRYKVVSVRSALYKWKSVLRWGLGLERWARRTAVEGAPSSRHASQVENSGSLNR